jgi:hypothetical protein
MKQTGSIGYEAVMGIKDHHLLAAVAACVELADELGPETDLAGSWILYRARMRIPGLWLPNFKPFVTLGILKRVGGSRGGARAYYRLVDPRVSKRAFAELGVPLRSQTAAAWVRAPFVLPTCQDG